MTLTLKTFNGTIFMTLTIISDLGTYHIFSKYGPGVNYFKIASDQALN